MDFLKFCDISESQLCEILGLSSRLKAANGNGGARAILKNKTLLMLFEKNSTRTRVSFEAAMTQLGGHAIFLNTGSSQSARGESYFDTGAAAGPMTDFIMARVHSHSSLEELAQGSPVPVINGLSDLEHPCQALADLLTLSELGKLGKGKKVAYVGDCANNVANSLACACAMSGTALSMSSPEGYEPNPAYLSLASKLGCDIRFAKDPAEAVKGADAVYTDTWVSMGDEAEEKKRLGAFAGYTVDNRLMGHAKKDAAFMHCLPAHRGQEVAPEVIDGPQSAVFRQAENRLHAQKGLLVWLSKHSG